MPQFIKFTEKEKADGERFVYVNIAHIVKATYAPKSRSLRLVVALDEAGKPYSICDLVGEEAEAAKNVLQTLP